MNWHLAPSLDVLRDELQDEFGSKITGFGTIGDKAHAARKSEHNPNRDSSDDVPNGAVTAMDVMTKDAGTMDAIVQTLIKDKRVWYVINRGHIWSSTYGFKKRKYTGANPHTHHVHVSLEQTRKAHDDRSSWFDKPAKPAPRPKQERMPVLKRGDTDPLVPVLKRFLGVVAFRDDPKFGTGLHRKVVRYQRMHGLEPDGVVGPNTWAKILSVLEV